jgi:ferredoxin--NADP+ reductase
MPQWCTGTVVNRQEWAPGLFTITVATDEVASFEPGQFLQLGVFQDGHDGDPDALINRPYSVASPHGTQLEFFIVTVPEGELTPRLEKLQEGSTLQVSKKAAGSFTLKKAPDAKHLWLVATGTGLAPYIAMLRTDEPWERFEKIVVVHGVRHASDFAYTEELKKYEAEKPEQFRAVQTLTREDSDIALRGRIPDLVASGQLEEATGCQLSAEESVVYLCGNPAMLDSMEEVLAERQMKKHRSKSPGHIVLERYW